MRHATGTVTKRRSEPHYPAYASRLFDTRWQMICVRWYRTLIPIVHGVAVICGVNASVEFRICVERESESSAASVDGMNLS